MPGQAKTNSFMLSSATVMIGPMANLFDLNPTAHSIGLVKNFQVASEPSFVELGQGIKNNIVMSVKNNDGIRCSMEVYEYTVRNLCYAAGLDASGATYAPNATTWVPTANVAAAATTVTIATDITSSVAVGDWIFLQNGTDDYVHVAKVTARSYGSPNTTITFAGYAIPSGITFTAATTRVGVVKRIDVGAAQPIPDLAAKVIGTFPKDNRPIVVVFPKIRITRGLGLSFQTDNFMNMPFEFTPYNLIASDPNYAEFSDNLMGIFPAQ